MRPEAPQIYAIIGPTATGKTIAGAALAKQLGTEVISVDSQIIYRDLNIGVARPTAEEMDGVPHHMIAVIPPDQAFSAGDYARMATPVLSRVLAKKGCAVLVGGTGFYLRALLQPDYLPKIGQDAAFREGLAGQPSEILHAQLAAQDPMRAEALHPRDRMRIVRALEIIHLTGQKVPQPSESYAYSMRIIGLTYEDREFHRQRIVVRLAQMIAYGFLDEVAALYEKYGDCFALQNAHGYPELRQVLAGKRGLDNALAQININIRQYSRRQMTWFKRLPDVDWINLDGVTDMGEVVAKVKELAT